MKTIVLACSGGPDSMALLDQCRGRYEIHAAHVNYKKRESADRDEHIVKTYCDRYGIAFHVLYPKWDHTGNFQAWARDIRYQFFEQLADTYGTDLIFVAHQLDDRIETYIFQKRRQMLCDTYGLAPTARRHGYTIVRPLLEQEKQELEDYCLEHGVPYGIDESNLTDTYTRNRIRHHITAEMSRFEKEQLCKKIDEENVQLTKRRQAAESWMEKCSAEELLQHPDAPFVLDHFLSRISHRHYAYDHLASLLKQMQSDCLIDLGQIELERFHDRIYCLPKADRIDRAFDAIQMADHETFVFQKEGRTIEGVTLTEKDFPIHVRTVQDRDRIMLRYGTKKVHRFFVDRKIPRIFRKRWLVMTDRNGQVIFVPGIGCDVEHFSGKPTVFMIQLIP
ncbi:MAG: tRNA lysidine(34) synthetase TilS [Catenisphaera adipataccumulans]|jgi:tRNA(Ile)-lysidine synthetase-like protein|uniref:tRNA lysidine(34) synthetase TilS n=1 Tax=Catenisphaera adipataccumulans TaxID=700500 RepID=UPI003D8B2DE2